MNKNLNLLPKNHLVSDTLNQDTDAADAKHQHEIIMDSVAEFEESLDKDHEIALKLAHIGQSITLNVTGIGYSNPSLIHFFGFIDNQKAELIQHITQLSFLMVSVKKQEKAKPARRIGFRSRE